MMTAPLNDVDCGTEVKAPVPLPASLGSLPFAVHPVVGRALHPRRLAHEVINSPHSPSRRHLCGNQNVRQKQGLPVKPVVLTAIQARTDFKTWAGETLAELLKLGLSFAVAWTLTQGNEVAAWVVMTGYTAWRWLRKLFLWRELAPKLKSVELLTKMEWVSESFKRLDYNPEGARQRIHALMLEGASFSPWVLNLLDRRVKE